MIKSAGLIGILFGIILFACYPKEKDPEIKIPEEQLIHILADLHIAQAAVKKFPVIERDSAIKKFKSQIAVVHQLDTNTLDSLVSELESYPSYLHELNGKLVEYLEELEAQVLERNIEKADD